MTDDKVDARITSQKILDEGIVSSAMLTEIIWKIRHLQMKTTRCLTFPSPISFIFIFIFFFFFECPLSSTIIHLICLFCLQVFTKSHFGSS